MKKRREMSDFSKSQRRNGKTGGDRASFRRLHVCHWQPCNLCNLASKSFVMSRLQNARIVIRVIFNKMDSIDNKRHTESNKLYGKKCNNLVRFSRNPGNLAVILAKKRLPAITLHPPFSSILRKALIIKKIRDFSAKGACVEAHRAPIYGNIY